MSVKKKIPSRRSAQTEVEAKDAGQSAAERKAAEAQTHALVAKFSPDNLRLVSATRRRLLERLPTAHEVVYEYRDCFVISYSPSEHGYEGVFAIRGSADGVKLYFQRGSELPDPAKLLRGSGGKSRSIDLEGSSTFARPEVVSLMEAAIALHSAPFASAGRGSIVLRSEAKKPKTAASRAGRKAPTTKKATSKKTATKKLAPKKAKSRGKS